jgi:phosphoribosylformylglycinamidine synthase
MKVALLVFPGSNCDRDARVALTRLCGTAPLDIWHAATEIPGDTDFIVVPGGFSHGDYLRPGAMAARAAVTPALVAHAGRGTPIVGICNGFQILTECGLLPGALMRNASLRFVARDVHLKVERADTAFTSCYRAGACARMPVAHMDGNYFADDETLARLEGEGRVAFRYVGCGDTLGPANPNGSAHDIAGIYNEALTVLGLMPHPERACDRRTGGTDGVPLFQSLIEWVQ